MIKKIIALYILFFSISVVADEIQRLNKEKNINEKLQRELQNLLKNQGALQKELSENEEQINYLNKEIYQLKESIKENEEKLDNFQKDKKKLLEKKKKQEKFIGYQLKILYQQEKNHLKILLNQKDISKMERNIAYNEYINKFQKKMLEDFQLTIDKLSELEIQIALQIEEITENKIILDENLIRANKFKEQRTKALAVIKKEQKTKKQQIEASRREQERLEKVIAVIEKELREKELFKQIERNNSIAIKNDSYSSLSRDQIDYNIYENNSNQNSIKRKMQNINSNQNDANSTFLNFKGSLPWPLKGIVVSTFGQAKFNDERVKLDGILIESKEGTTVKSIHYGKVIFSQFLQGSGLLIILDHGFGYMSLYGYNETLLKSVGDVVYAGDNIAIVGNSGSYDKSALYFSIRKNGKPIDPQIWLRKI